MKRIFSLATLLLLIFAGLSSCKKDNTPDNYTCATCVKTPEANAAHDASSKGIYKGILIASTGTIKFDIANNGNTITAVMIIDGKTVNLTSNVTWVNGQAYVAPFTGTLNNQTVTINFSVGASGSNPTVVSSNIPGHPNAVFTIVKETSNSLIECFEGTYSTTRPERGTFNILIARSLGLWGGVAREEGTTVDESIDGTVAPDGTFKDDNGRTMGKLTGDQLSGSFKDSNNNTVTISGRRTL